MVRNGLCFTYLLLPFAILVAGVWHFRSQTSFPDTGFWPRRAPLMMTSAPSRPPAEAQAVAAKPDDGATAEDSGCDKAGPREPASDSRKCKAHPGPQGR